MKGIDQVLGQETEHEADNVTILKEYVKNMPMIEHMSEKKAETVARAIDSVTAKQTWIIKLLGANTAYVERNPGEVIVMLLISALIMAVVHFFIQSAAIVGKCVMPWSADTVTRCPSTGCCHLSTDIIYSDLCGSCSVTMLL